MGSKRRNIIIALMVAMFLGAVEGTVVTTAIPTIAKDLKGFEMISWVFSLYLLTSAISTPIYGKLSDLFGRKNTLSVGIIIFLVGSSLCGLSQNMYQLIAFRAVQGCGAGAIFTITYTIVGDIFSLSERAKVQGWLGTVWGVASLTGPFLGGFLIDYLSWHWIFFINVPFGIISIILLQKNLIESYEKKKHKIDYAGTLTLSGAILALLYGVLISQQVVRFDFTYTTISILIAIIFLVLFYYIEKRADEPIIPFEIFTRSNTIANLVSFLSSAVLIGADVYMPIYIQNVLGYSATISGLAMAPMSLAWFISSVILVKAIPRYGERIIIGFSTFIILVSCILLATLKIQSSLIFAIIYSFIMGFGFGGAFTTLTIAVQSSVDYSRRGAATASNSLLRTLGQTIGVSIFGLMFNFNIIKYFDKLGIKGVEPDNLYSLASAGREISVMQIRISIIAGAHIVFIALVIITVFCLVLTALLSNNLKGE